MSTITARGPGMNGTAARDGSPTPHLDALHSWTDDEKEDVLIALLRELIDNYGGGKGLISIETPEGESLGYYVPPLAAQARAELYLPKLTPEEEAELEELANDDSPGMPIGEWIAELKARAAELETKSHE